MIITDINGGTLKLGTKTLTELTGEMVEGELWSLKLKNLVKNHTNNRYEKELPITNNYDTRIGWAKLIPSSYQIGCRFFDSATFNKIMKAAKQATQRKLKGTKKK